MILVVTGPTLIAVVFTEVVSCQKKYPVKISTKFPFSVWYVAQVLRRSSTHMDQEVANYERHIPHRKQNSGYLIDPLSTAYVVFEQSDFINFTPHSSTKS